MLRTIYSLALLACLCLVVPDARGGNPDRQGEAGAYELLMNPYARSAGLHTMTTSSVSGVEAFRLNPAGVARIQKVQFVASHAIYLEGTGVNMNAFGFATRIGKGAFGFSLMSLDFGDIPITTTDQPEGTGATFSPSFFNIGLGYAHIFENKVSVGVTFRGISERISNLTASTFAVDAGVQYVTGENDNFKFGISLRNVGGRMQFKGEGLSFQTDIPFGSVGYGLAVDNRAAGYELQSVLNLGGSYDFLIGQKNRLTIVGNFTSNAFSRDQIGGGLELALTNVLMLRGGYKYEIGQTSANEDEAPLYSGPSGGVSLEVPLNKEKADSGRFGIDYAYRATRIFGGTHNISVKLDL